MWSVGIVAYLLLVGYLPFAHENREMVCHQIKAGSWSFYPPDWCRISKEAQDLITGLLQVDPKERWSAEEALRCAWIQKSDKTLSNYDLKESQTKLRNRRAQLREAASNTMTWFANKKADLLHLGFVSKPIISPTQANEIIVEDSIGNFEVKG
jgi:serine/threonine protein kinase